MMRMVYRISIWFVILANDSDEKCTVRDLCTMYIKNLMRKYLHRIPNLAADRPKYGTQSSIKSGDESIKVVSWDIRIYIRSFIQQTNQTLEKRQTCLQQSNWIIMYRNDRSNSCFEGLNFELSVNLNFKRRSVVDIFKSLCFYCHLFNVHYREFNSHLE